MIHLITGKPGHAKNIYSLTLLEQKKYITYDKENKSFFVTDPEEQPVYFISFKNIKIKDARVITAADLDGLPIDYEEENKSTIANNSVIVIDEAHRISPKSANKEGFTALVSFLKIHRHYGFNFIFITQNQRDINIDIRNLVENHYKVVRPFAVKASFANLYNGCETRENPMPLKQETKRFALDPRFFKIYDSATVHDYKANIPKKYFVFVAIILAVVYMALSSGYGLYQKYLGGDLLGGNSTVTEPEIKAPSVPYQSQVQLTPEQFESQRQARFSHRLAVEKKPFFYKFTVPSRLVDNKTIFEGFSKDIIFAPDSIFCYCTKKQISILEVMLAEYDTYENANITFVLVSMTKKNFLDFSLNYSFAKGFFRVSPGAPAINNLLILDYLKTDFDAKINIKSSSLVRVGESFNYNFLTKYPNVLKKYQNNDTDQNNIVDETIEYIDVGFKFNLKTEAVSSSAIGLDLEQSHSFTKGSFADIPVLDTREYTTKFILNENVLVPLFNLSSVLNSNSKSDTFPFLSWFLPDSIDNEDVSYQVFLKFNFSK